MGVRFCLLLFLFLTVKAIAQEETCDETVATDSGYACYFPFVYEDKVHSQCIAAGKDKPWCALIPEVDDVSDSNHTVNWDYCVVKTNGSGICKFPFTYDNVTYNECTSDGQDHGWCRISQDDEDWGFCKYPCLQTTHLCYNNMSYHDLCPVGHVVSVLAAEVGHGDGKCAASNKPLCRKQVQKIRVGGSFTAVFIYEELKKKCNFQRKCEELDFIKASCDGGDYEADEYLKVTYRCQKDTEFYLCSETTLCSPFKQINIATLETTGFEICSTPRKQMEQCTDGMALKVQGTEDSSALERCRSFTPTSTLHPYKHLCFHDSNGLELVEYTCTEEYTTANLTQCSKNQSFCGADRYPVIDDVKSKLLCENSSNCDPLTDNDSLAIKESIQGACNWNESCLLPIVDDILPVLHMENTTCDNYSVAVQTKVHHYCKQATYQFTGELFSDVLCDFPYFINVTNVVKGVSACAKCPPSPNDDLFVVPDEFPQYYDEVLAACDGRTNCSELPAEPANAYDLTGGDSLVTNYVLIEYTCEYNEEETSTNAETTIISTHETTAEFQDGPHTSVVHSSAPSSSTSATGLDTGRSSTNDAAISYLIIIIPAVLGGIIVLIAGVVLVVCCCKKRKSQDVSLGNDNKSFSTDPESHEMKPGNVPGVPDNAYEYVKEDNMMRASLLEGAYQEIPGNHYVPNNARPLSPTQDAPRVTSLGNQSQPQRPLSYNISGSEYQEISSIEKARKSKLLNDKPTEVVNELEPINEKPTEEGTGNLYSDKPDDAPVEYAQVSKPKKQKKGMVSGTENTQSDQLQNDKPTDETMNMEPVPTDEAMNSISSDMQDGSPDENANISKPNNEKKEIMSETEQIETGELVENESYEGFSDIKAPEPKPEANDTNEKPDMQAATDSKSSDMQDGSPDENANISKPNNEKKEIMSETEQIETGQLVENVSYKGLSDIKATEPKPEPHDTNKKPDPESKEDTEKPVMAVDEPKDDRDKAEN